MNLPTQILLFFQETFNGSQIQIIDDNWNKFSRKQLSVMNCTREQLLNHAKKILQKVNAR